MPTDPPDANAHVRAYLRHYLAFQHSPHFAVLLAGPWGVGKTHLLRGFLAEEMRDRRVAYVSLYGMTSSDDIDEGLFAALYPKATGKAARIATGVAKALLKHVKYEVDLEKSDLLDRFAADVYVFDDLERSGMRVNEALGYINRFVEHDGCRVIIVANVDEIAPDERAEFARRREKLVGKTLEVRSAFDDAYTWFLSKISDPATVALLADERAGVASLYDQSELRNLRILQQTMWDFERLCVAVEDRHRDHEPGMRALLRLFFALSFEVKAGRLGPPDLRDRVQGVMLGLLDDRKTPTPMRVADDRYPSVRLYDTLLNDDVLQELLIAGVVDAVAIRASIDRSPDFSTEEEPAWRVVWNAFDRTEKQVLAAIATMDRQFADHEFVVGGEILHVVGLQLHLSDLGISGFDRAATVYRAKRYIDQVRQLGTLELALEPGRDDLRYGGHAGLGLTQADTPEMGDVFHHLRAARAAAAVDRHPTSAAALLSEMPADPVAFAHQVDGTDPECRAGREPVLAAIDPAGFVDAFLGLAADGQRTVATALSHRYDCSRLLRELAGEVNWARSVEALLLEAAAKASPLTRHRLLLLAQHSISKRLAELNPDEQDPTPPD